MGDILAIDQMKVRFPQEWVLIAEPQTDESARLLAGRVVSHSPARDEVYREAVALRLPRFAVRYLGDLPKEMALAL